MGHVGRRHRFASGDGEAITRNSNGQRVCTRAQLLTAGAMTRHRQQRRDSLGNVSRRTSIPPPKAVSSRSSLCPRVVGSVHCAGRAASPLECSGGAKPATRPAHHDRTALLAVRPGWRRFNQFQNRLCPMNSFHFLNAFFSTAHALCACQPSTMPAARCNASFRLPVAGRPSRSATSLSATATSLR